jgi:hypothetical protein
MTDLLRKSNMKINRVLCGELSTLISSQLLTRVSPPKDLSLTDKVPNTDTAVTAVKVAMLSTTSQNWSR